MAHAYLALTTIACGGYGAASDDVKEHGIALARRAVELDPREATCHRLLGRVLLYMRHFDVAEHHARRAVELNPNDAEACIGLGVLLVQRGKVGEGVDWMRKAVLLNPFHPPWYQNSLGAGLFALGRFEEAVAILRPLPKTGGWSFRLAACYGHLGLEEEAGRERDAMLRAMPNFSTERFVASTVLTEHDADRDLIREGLLKAGLPA